MIDGDVDLRAYAARFETMVVRRGSDVMRADRIYLEPGGRSALVEALVVEAGRKLPFYVRISTHRRGSATVRIDPMTHVERSEAVKQLVAHLGAQLLATTPGASVRTSNLVLPSGPQGRGGEG